MHIGLLLLLSNIGRSKKLIGNSHKKKDCAQMQVYVQVSNDAQLDKILNAITSECIAHYFADCSGDLIDRVYQTDGAVLGREMAQAIYQTWFS